MNNKRGIKEILDELVAGKPAAKNPQEVKKMIDARIIELEQIIGSKRTKGPGIAKFNHDLSLLRGVSEAMERFSLNSNQKNDQCNP